MRLRISRPCTTFPSTTCFPVVDERSRPSSAVSELFPITGIDYQAAQDSGAAAVEISSAPSSSAAEDRVHRKRDLPSILGFGASVK